MIWLYSGTPGSGKSLHTARDIMLKLRRGHRVIANFPINLDVVRKGKLFFKFKIDDSKFIYKDNPDLTVKFLVNYARQNHKPGKEGQTLLVIDECSVLFNPRDIMVKGNMPARNAWIKFFQHHRKLGYNIVLIAQNDRLLDRQIRAFIEYDVKHRKANNYGMIGKIFSIFMLKLFVAVEYWYGVREKCGIEFFLYSKKLGKLYDSYKMFDEELMPEIEKEDDVTQKWINERKAAIEKNEKGEAANVSGEGPASAGGDSRSLTA